MNNVVSTNLTTAFDKSKNMELQLFPDGNFICICKDKDVENLKESIYNDLREIDVEMEKLKGQI
jgi:hypothetical protein